MSQLEQLTKKNQEFIKIATKQLITDGKSDSEIKAILEEALPQIISAQATGETARHLLGAPTAWAASFSQPAPAEVAAETEKNTNPWLMWLDVSLLFMGLISLVNILTSLFSQDAPPAKLISLLALGMLGGWAMYLTYYHIYRHMNKPVSERPGMLKSMVIFAGAMMVWILVSSLTALLPDSINLPLAPLALAIIAAISLGGRYWLKKTYNIQSAMSPVR